GARDEGDRHEPHDSRRRAARTPAAPAPPAPSAGVPPGTPVLTAGTNLVVLPIIVRGRHGRVIPGLTKADFAVYDDGVPQTVQFFDSGEAPVTVGLVLDNSGSMQAKLSSVISAATVFAQTSNPLDQIFVVNFNQRVSMGLPPGVPFTSSVPQLEKALDTVSAEGMTALYDAVVTALHHLAKGTHQRRVLLVISDGGDDASRTTRQEAVAAAERANVTIYTVGLFDQYDDDRDPGVLKELAHVTGGEAFFPRHISDAARVCQRIARIIRSGYTIGYTPAGVGTRHGRHTIRVVLQGDAARHGYHVTTRPDYVTAPAPRERP
ncbi:MAG: VWA domain-containing protein, partial [Acidobacteriota bacterium]|nr:VWA domain-containing protein [Acidobacteriota bacterium]